MASLNNNSSNNAAEAALDALSRHDCKPARHGAFLVWRADVTAELYSGGETSSAPLRRLLDACFSRRFSAPPGALPDVVASAYAPGALFDSNLAKVVGTQNIAAAWRFLAAPFVSVGVAGTPRVEVVAWAPAAAAGEPEQQQEQEEQEAAVAKPPAAAQATEQQQPPRPPPTRPPSRGVSGVALVVETEQRWRLARALVLVRAVFGDDLRVVVTSTLRLSRAAGGGGKVAAHADRVEGWWAVPRPLRAALGALAPVVVTVLGW